MKPQQNIYIKKFSNPLSLTNPDGQQALNGYNFVVKDNIGIKGEKTLAGNPNWRLKQPAEIANAFVIDQLLAAGAKCHGIVAGDDLAFSLSGRDNHLPQENGVPVKFVNPHDPSRVVGGSSSGPVIALVEDQNLDFSIGTDTGGSSRVPPAYCGLYGFRPSTECVSSAGVTPNAPVSDVAGVFARDSKVLEAVGKVITASNVEHDSEIIPGKIYVIQELLELCDDEVKQQMDFAIGLMQRQYPNKVISISLADITQDGVAGPEQITKWITTSLPYLFAEIASELAGEAMALGEAAFTSTVWDNFQGTMALPRETLGNIAIMRRQYTEALRNYIGPDDVLMLPTAPTLAPKIDGGDQTIAQLKNTFACTCYASIAGLPQITVPAAEFSVEQTATMPVGISFIGAHRRDTFLLNFVSVMVQTLQSGLKAQVATDFNHEDVEYTNEDQAQITIARHWRGFMGRKETLAQQQLNKLFREVPKFVSQDFVELGIHTQKLMDFKGYLANVDLGALTPGSISDDCWRSICDTSQNPASKINLSKANNSEKLLYKVFLSHAKSELISSESAVQQLVTVASGV